MTPRRITLRTLTRWPENEVEGSATFVLFGRELEARVVLGDDEWEEWGPGFALEGEVYLRRFADLRREARTPGLTRTGTAAYEAAGCVVGVDEEDETVTLDVGFPLPVRLGYGVTAAEGEALVVSGELELEVV